MLLERYCGIGLGPNRMENCWGLFGEKKSLIRRYSRLELWIIWKHLELFLESRYLYFARIVRSASFLFQSILNKVSRYGCEKECGYMNFFFNVRKKRGEKKTWSLNERHIFNLIHDCLTRN